MRPCSIPTSRSAFRSRRRLLETTDRAFQAVVSDGWLPRLLRTTVIARVAATAMKFAPVRRFAFRTISQIGISYPQSALSQALAGLPKDAPAAGERFPWMRIRLSGRMVRSRTSTASSRIRASISWFSGEHASATEANSATWSGLISFRAMRRMTEELARANIGQPSFYLLRPDGHVGLCGPGFDAAAIRQYLAERACFKV